MKHLIDINRLEKSEIERIIEVAREFKIGARQSTVVGKTACLMFFENSTRTKISFDLAAQKLGMNVIHFDGATSSLSKGESRKDTFENLSAIGIDTVIVRTTENHFIDNSLKELSLPLSFVNAGDGVTAHPTQALLDYFTMNEKFGEIAGKKVVIIGDIAHSRVAKSNFALLTKFGAELHAVAPAYFMPEESLPVTYHDNLAEGIKDADVVMLLRVQKERLEREFDGGDYIEKYQLNSEILQKYAPNAILMHPGPVNRGVEITSELLDSEKGKTVLEQAHNGVFVRMAVLEILG
ncbi:MAG: aspartate carbamoyltransferase catalytic subunit [Fusobacterium sp.]|nr:aspartate carbamoyltransferase catalytic subunit [Fusobacterium sp.]